MTIARVLTLSILFWACAASAQIKLAGVWSKERFVISNELPVKVTVDGETVGALPVTNNTSKRRLVIRSELVRTPDGKLEIFYPVISVLSASGEVTRTLKPRYELAFRDDALSNEFELPAGEANLVVHSSKAYWDSGYEGPVSKNASAFNPVAVGAALGGMIGALIAHTITGAGERAQGFTFGKSGVIGFEWDD